MGRALLLGFSIRGVAVSTIALGFVLACSSTRGSGFDENNNADPNGESSGGLIPIDGGFGADGEAVSGECADAIATKSYVGCDYWPTVTANGVWSIFDFAAVVANTGKSEAEVTVTGPNSVNKKVTVPPGELRKIYLPWVPALKGGDANAAGQPPAFTSSVVAGGGAYHLVSTRPVIVYQFNALEYKGAGGEGPNGGAKDWSKCPGSGAFGTGCFSYSNDASLLLPSSAMTGTYRVVGQHGWTEQGGLFGGGGPIHGSTLTFTAVQADTEITVTLSPTAKVLASKDGKVPATNGGGTLKLALAQPGDVIELATEKGEQYDFGGSLVKANKPVQVISGVPCINLPKGKPACDHVEETVLPAETLGKQYLVHPPTGPNGKPAKHNVRFFGNVDGTTLQYKPSKPASCPDTLSAGQVADCQLVSDAFEVTGSHEFGVGTWLLGAAEINGSITDLRGDPSQSAYAAVEQFRADYVFLAPDDYPVSYADITAPEGADVKLDGKPLTEPWTRVGDSTLGVYRVTLGAGKGGAHTLTAAKPVGVQVIGYGDNTSYEYPAGLNLKLIAPPPVK
jgi:hypothetical protein